MPAWKSLQLSNENEGMLRQNTKSCVSMAAPPGFGHHDSCANTTNRKTSDLFTLFQVGKIR